MTARVLNPRNAALDIAFDVVFGVIPAVICALYAIFGAVSLVSIASLSSEFAVLLLLMLLSVTGFGSSLALLYTIFTRDRVKHNAIVRGLLIAGMVVALVGFVMVLYILSNVLEQAALTIVLLMIVMCASKYLRVLSNPEVHP